jgi:hypothetical protein
LETVGSYEIGIVRAVAQPATEKRPAMTQINRLDGMMLKPDRSFENFHGGPGHVDAVVFAPVD